MQTHAHIQELKEPRLKTVRQANRKTIEAEFLKGHHQMRRGSCVAWGEGRKEAYCCCTRQHSAKKILDSCLQPLVMNTNGLFSMFRSERAKETEHLLLLFHQYQSSPLAQPFISFPFALEFLRLPRLLCCCCTPKEQEQETVGAKLRNIEHTHTESD